MRAIQDDYPEQFAHCHGCGPRNANGMRFRSVLEGDETVLRYTPEPEYTGGVPDHVYGGLIASLLDCHGAASATAFARRAEEERTGAPQEPDRYVTGTLAVVYRRPTPMGVELTVRGRLKELSGRKAVIGLELEAGGEVTVTGEMIAISIGKA